MPTDIYFAGDRVLVRVDDDPRQVAEAFASANGLPFRLESYGGRAEVYVNPATVAFWSASQPDADSEASPQPGQAQGQREAVTDIWGNPLRKKRRR